MVKKYGICGLLIVLLMIGSPLFSMHATVLRFSKIVGAFLTIYPGWSNAYSSKKERSIYRDPMPDEVQVWAKDILKECGINEKNVSFAIANRGETSVWRVIGGNQVIANQRVVKELVHNLQIIEDANASDEKLQMAQRIIACNDQMVKHEAGHIWHQHYKKNIMARVVGPCVIQIASSGITAASKNIFRVKPPTTFLRTGICSLLAIGSALPKIIATKYFFKPDPLVHEKEADAFAWSHAKSDFELKALKDFYQAVAANSPGPFGEVSNVTTGLEYYDAMSEHEKEALRIGGLLDQSHAKVDKYYPTPLARVHALQKHIDVMGSC